MILKILAILAVLFFVYLVFFKKSRKKSIKNKKEDKIEDEMIECATCKIYISQREAILSNGKFYCSKECIENK